jgi:protein ImuB
MFGGLHSKQPLPSPSSLLELARDFTPRVEAREPTPVLLDLFGLGRSWPTPHALGHAILEAGRARRLVPSLALAHSRIAALVLARSRDGLTIVPPGGEASVLAPFPLEVLGLPGERLELFARWGVRTLGELAALPAGGLVERLGADGPRLLRRARGEDEAPLVPTAPARVYEMSLELDWPVEGLEPLSFLLARVLEPLCAGLVARGCRAAVVRASFGLVDGSTYRREIRPAAPSAEPRTWRTLLLLDLEAHPPRDGIQAIRVEAEPTPSRLVQFSLLDPAQPSPERLAETMGRLQSFTDAGRGGAPALLETHRPGAFALGTFAPGPLAKRRPPAPGAPRVALRAFRPPLRAEVLTTAGAPSFVAASGVRGAVIDRAGPWRASGDWWDVAFSREEWDVALAAGAYRIFHDRRRDAWFVEGELD